MMTVRDDIWSEIIQIIVEEGKFKISDLPVDESQRQTVRRVCREMEEMGFLRRTSEQAKTWRAGEMANDYLDLSRRAEVMKDE